MPVFSLNAVIQRSLAIQTAVFWRTVRACLKVYPDCFFGFFLLFLWVSYRFRGWRRFFSPGVRGSYLLGLIYY